MSWREWAETLGAVFSGRHTARYTDLGHLEDHLLRDIGIVREWDGTLSAENTQRPSGLLSANLMPAAATRRGGAWLADEGQG